MRQLTVMRGLSGSGKTTIAEEYAKRCQENGTPTLVFSTDDYFMLDGEYKFDVEKLEEAHAWNFRRFVAAVNEGTCNIVIDNTNITAAEFSPYMMYAKAFGYKAKIITVVCDWKTAYERNRHGVPENTVKRQYTDMDEERIPWFFEQERVSNC